MQNCFNILNHQIFIQLWKMVSSSLSLSLSIIFMGKYCEISNFASRFDFKNVHVQTIMQTLVPADLHLYIKVRKIWIHKTYNKCTNLKTHKSQENAFARKFVLGGKKHFTVYKVFLQQWPCLYHAPGRQSKSQGQKQVVVCSCHYHVASTGTSRQS